jgi:hypothetical protein
LDTALEDFHLLVELDLREEPQQLGFTAAICIDVGVGALEKILNDCSATVPSGT